MSKIEKLKVKIFDICRISVTPISAPEILTFGVNKILFLLVINHLFKSEICLAEISQTYKIAAEIY